MNTNTKKKLLGLIGAIVLFIGVLVPTVGIPFFGNISYLQYATGRGTIVLLLGVASLVLVLKKKYKGLWFTGIGSLGIILSSSDFFGATLSIVGAVLVIASAAIKDETQ